MWRLIVIEEAAKRSREHFMSGYYCAESVLLAVSEAMGVETDLIPKIATGFCSGMGRTGNQCGALSGGILGISLFTGRSEPGDTVDKNYAKVRELINTFENKFGSTSCFGLTGCDLSTEQGQNSFYEQELIDKCYQFTEEATRLTMKLVEGE
jgi:C_GCAxxG_C_C family probable redox protein